jgi:hypothetical protein
MTEVTEQIQQAGCHATPRGAWVCLPQSCNRTADMCPELLARGLLDWIPKRGA